MIDELEEAKQYALNRWDSAWTSMEIWFWGSHTVYMIPIHDGKIGHIQEFSKDCGLPMGNHGAIKRVR